MIRATERMQRVAALWRDLAEQRRDHFVELFKSGRWRHYYDDKHFLLALEQSVMIADRWAAIAPRPEELEETTAATSEDASDAPASFMLPDELAA